LDTGKIIGIIFTDDHLRRHQYTGRGKDDLSPVPKVARSRRLDETITVAQFRFVTANKFRSLALSFSDAVESAPMGHPDFRVKGKIFATLGYPDEEWGVVKLTPAQQREFLKQAPGVFAPCSGVWGRRGATQIRLKPASVSLIRDALAWQGTM
jgi:hypothetical protein